MIERQNSDQYVVGTIEEKKRRRKEARRIFDVILPDSQPIKIRGKLKTRALDALAIAANTDGIVKSENTVSLASILYGFYNNYSGHLVYSIMRSLQRDKNLERAGWRISVSTPNPYDKSDFACNDYLLEKTQSR